MRRAPTIVSILLVAACSPPPSVTHWARPGGSEAAYEASASSCEADAMRQAPPMALGMPGYFPNATTWCSPNVGGVSCVPINPGYLPQVQSSADTNAPVRERLFGSCMMAGGWRPAASPAEGEAITRSATAPGAPLPETAVARALTWCQGIFKHDRNAEFDRCVMRRAHELNVPG